MWGGCDAEGVREIDSIERGDLRSRTGASVSGGSHGHLSRPRMDVGPWRCGSVHVHEGGGRFSVSPDRGKVEVAQLTGSPRLSGTEQSVLKPREISTSDLRSNRSGGPGNFNQPARAKTPRAPHRDNSSWWFCGKLP